MYGCCMDKSKKTILIVDDHELDRKILHKILQDEYELIDAVDGREALNVLRIDGKRISVILLDLIMPVMNGYEFLASLSGDSWLRIPVIALTEDRKPGAERKALDLGASDFVPKPFEPEILRIRVRNAISRSRLVLMQELQFMAERDSLTGLYNMSKTFSEIRRMLDRNSEKTFAIIRMDIDRFRLMNTFWGEKAGDNLLKYVADLLRAQAEQNTAAVYGRIHADIFCMCVPYVQSKIEKLITTIRNRVSGYNEDYVVESTFGIYVIEDPSISIEAMYSRASMASRECKKQYMVYETYYNKSMGQSLLREQQMLNEMGPALEKGEFEAWFQPKYNLQTGQPYGAEALVRWRHPVHGLIMPGTFVPLFEKNGFIGKLDYFMWDSVCRTLRRWIDEGINPAPISVNISRVNMYNPNIVSILTNLVGQYGLDPGMLNLELTESAYMDNPDIMKHAVRALQKAGFVIMMDDFGSGYSSLNTLKDIPVDILKIDIAFLAGEDTDGRNERILASVIRMAGWLEIPVVVEGVETDEQVNFLKSVGCGYVQGFYFARPMCESDYEAYLKDNIQVPLRPDNDNREALVNALWGSNAEAALLFKGFEHPVAIYDVSNGNYQPLRVNEAYNDWFGYGENILSPKGGYRHHLTQSGFREIMMTFANAIDTHGTADCEYLWSDGAEEQRWIRLHLNYLGKNENANILLATFDDKTSRHYLEEQVMSYRDCLEDTSLIRSKILIVDDTELGRELVRMVFEQNYEVLEADNGKEALNVIQQNKDIVCIILDLMMPVMDGIEFLKKRQKTAYLSNIPVVVVSADADEKNQLNMLELGVNDYVVKPFLAEMMRKRVRNVIDYNSRFHQIQEEYRKLMNAGSDSPKGRSKS